jgi:glutamyl-tRNA synthetase
MEELIESFSFDRVGKAGAKYDPDKARWYNQQYLRSKSNEAIADELLAFHDEIEEIKKVEKPYLAKVCGLMKERATFLADIPNEGAYLFHPAADFDEKTVQKKWKEGSAGLMIEWAADLEKLNDFTAEKVELSFKSFLESKELGIGKVLPLFRLLLTGQGMGPSMFAIAELLGKEETLKRMENGISTLG